MLLICSSLDKTYAAHMQTMGETGAGIEHEDEIDLTQDNEFVNKWRTYDAFVPTYHTWRFEANHGHEQSKFRSASHGYGL